MMNRYALLILAILTITTFQQEMDKSNESQISQTKIKFIL